MIFRQYGISFQSVDLNFDSRALNEVSFRRNHQRSIGSDDFRSAYELVEIHEIVAEAEGDVQDYTEQQLLDKLENEVDALSNSLGEGEALVIENEQGRDYPKTKQQTSNVILDGENRLHFIYTIAPPLRIARYRYITR
ncbi:MAG TPA: hypothetical protein EYN99_00970 [Gemmatimonadetes bacterium]|jgi:hypothetical protein|nr:hypothetical protein [Gemmatimonadota bacterium]